ncbi:MAG TPA: hypothetical protein VGO59_07430 [Verrucomicrobiae bacterium]
MWRRFQLAGILLAAAALAGCAAPPSDWRPGSDGSAETLRQVMARQDKIIRLSPAPAGRPILLLLHGATDDPTEMMSIARAWRNNYDVYLYSYNYHHRVKKAGLDLDGEIRRLKAEDAQGGPMTVLDFSYSAIVFREAVILANDPALFDGDSLIQLVPTAGGSRLARTMEFPPFAWLVSPFSHPSAAENPCGSLARKLWDGEGNRKFYEAIDPARVRTFLVENDIHSLARSRNKNVLRRYENGIGTNVVIIPKSAGVTHDYFPMERGGLDYLRMALDRSSQKTGVAAISPGF